METTLVKNPSVDGFLTSVVSIHFGLIYDVFEVHLISVVRPGPKLQSARMTVDWVLGQIDHTGGFEFGRRYEQDLAVTVGDRKRFGIF